MFHSLRYTLQVSLVHRNFAQTEEMVQNLKDLYDKLDAVSEMLASDSQDILGPAPNLLAIHYQLTQLEDFRNQMMHQAKSASADARITLSQYFEPLHKQLTLFDEYIWELARNVLPIVKAGHASVIVRLVKIVEVEAREDEKVSTRALRGFIVLECIFLFAPLVHAQSVSFDVLLNRQLPLNWSRKPPAWMQLQSSSPCWQMREELSITGRILWPRYQSPYKRHLILRTSGTGLTHKPFWRGLSGCTEISSIYKKRLFPVSHPITISLPLTFGNTTKPLIPLSAKLSITPQMLAYCLPCTHG